MTVSSSTSIFMLSLLGIPITYVVNKAQNLHGERGLFISGTVALVGLCLLTYRVVRREGRPTDSLFYVFILGAFASVVDLIIALENDGIIYGFMTNYLKNGEPYLKTAYGTMICYWDGIGHYAMYLMMLSALAWNESYREVGLFWSGSIGHSMIVLILGGLSGKYGVHWSILLNVPYMFIPFLGGARFLKERPANKPLTDKESKFVHKSIMERKLDMVLVAGLVLSMCISVFRGLIVLESPASILSSYLRNIEPYLVDPSNFPKLQMFVYLFYFFPYYIMCVYGLLYPGCSWMPDWALLHGGAAAQAQVSHIGSSLHHRTPYLLRVPPSRTAQLVFWLVNGILLVLPQVLAYRCTQHPAFFTPSKTDNDQAPASRNPNADKER